MLKKGVISNKNGSYAEVFIPDEDNAVTAMLPFTQSIDPTAVSVGDKCVVAFFDADYINLADGVIVAITEARSGDTHCRLPEATEEDEGKIAMVQGGVWTKATILTAEDLEV